MRLCRFEHQGRPTVGVYFDSDRAIPLSLLAEKARKTLPATDSLLPFLTGGEAHALARELVQSITPELERNAIEVKRLLVPIPDPKKLLLLAGNYSKHIEEGGGIAAERERTFPYVFMKPPTTTLTHPGDPVTIPLVSPDHVDWELELGVVIGKRCKSVTEQEALGFVAGYTVVNDISDRKYRPNPGRQAREKDSFFDWLHGKWHDTFCPVGPCVLDAEALPDPQKLPMELRLNGEVEQKATTGEMVFPVAAIVAFISRSVTLEPGDIISTGTPSGVGAAKGKYLKPGDLLEAEITGIGILRNPVHAGSDG